MHYRQRLAKVHMHFISPFSVLFTILTKFDVDIM